MRFERNRTASTQAVEAETVESVCRVDDATLKAEAVRLAAAAEIELEEFCQLALLTQTITAITEDAPASPLSLPIGPVASDASATVWTIADDGTETALDASEFWLETGRHPRIRWTDAAPELRVKVEYPAGFGASASDVPHDIRHAIADQAAAMLDWPALELRKSVGLTPHAARIAARYRRVAL